MTQKSKHTLAAGLLALFTLQVFIPLAVFISIQAVKISQEKFIHENFSETALFEKLVLTETEYQKLEYRNKKEIFFNHVLYDIHSVKKENGKYILCVLSDEKEKKLEETAMDNASKENTTPFSMLFAFLFYEDQSLVFFNIHNDRPDLLIEQKEFISITFIKVPSPPPDTRA